jgi:hypothetical protein
MKDPSRYLIRRIALVVLAITWASAYIRLSIPDACVHPLAHILAFLVVVLLPMVVVVRICEEEK